MRHVNHHPVDGQCARLWLRLERLHNAPRMCQLLFARRARFVDEVDLIRTNGDLAPPPRRRARAQAAFSPSASRKSACSVSIASTPAAAHRRNAPASSYSGE